MKRDTDQTTKQFPWKSGYLARVFELRPLPRFHDCSLRSRRSSSAKLIRKSGRAARPYTRRARFSAFVRQDASP
jgi:hypothetical protein